MRVFKCLAQAHSNDNTGKCRESDVRSGTIDFKTLRCVIEVAYIFASVKAITIKFLVREKTTRKELHPLELTSKVTTVFVYNGTSRAGPSPGFRSRGGHKPEGGAKKQKGATFLKYSIGCMQQPEGQT